MKNVKLVLILIALLASCSQCTKEIKQQKLSAHAFSNSETGARPNVILVLIDDMGFEVPTVNGGQSYSTPNMDAFAMSGIQFTQAHSCPLCSPSRVQILTGKDNFRNYKEWGWMDASNLTLGNLMKDAGYATGIFGKWQESKYSTTTDEADLRIKGFGFDTYILHDAMDAKNRGPRYKSPHLFTHGAFLPDDVTNDKYGPDIISDSLFAFIEKHKEGKPFFAYYPIPLCHKSFQPTPDDPEYLSFDVNNSDPAYYPSMVKYCDKLIGKLIAKLDEIGLSDNTIVIITSDNGTPGKAPASLYKGQWITGGKGKTTEWGTHVPFWVKWEGHTVPKIDTSLVDFNDIMATLKDISGGSTSDYGTLDGISFYHNILGFPGINRDYIYYDYRPNPADDEDGEDSTDDKKDKHAIWVQNSVYKKYDDSLAFPNYKRGKLYNMTLDYWESDSTFLRGSKTRKERLIDTSLQQIIYQYKQQH